MICVIVALSLFRVDILAFVNALIRVQSNQHTAPVELGSVVPLPSAKIHRLKLDAGERVMFLNEHVCLVYLLFGGLMSIRDVASKHWKMRRFNRSTPSAGRNFVHKRRNNCYLITGCYTRLKYPQACSAVGLPCHLQS